MSLLPAQLASFNSVVWLYVCTTTTYPTFPSLQLPPMANKQRNKQTSIQTNKQTKNEKKIVFLKRIMYQTYIPTIPYFGIKKLQLLQQALNKPPERFYNFVDSYLLSETLATCCNKSTTRVE